MLHLRPRLHRLSVALLIDFNILVTATVYKIAYSAMYSWITAGAPYLKSISSATKILHVA